MQQQQHDRSGGTEEGQFVIAAASAGLPATGAPRKFAYVDAARGIAILMVVLVHTAAPFSNLNAPTHYLSAFGQLGVQLFFVASAFTLCLSQHHRHEERSWIRSFAIRRFFRIAPVYYLGIVFYFLISYIDSADVYGAIRGEHYTALNILSHVAFIHAFVPPATNVVVPGGWSIGVEMAFYLLFPLAYSAVAGRSERAAIRALAVAWLGAVLANTAIQIWFLTPLGYPIGNNNYAYSSLPNQLAVFIAGMILFFLWRRNQGFEPLIGIASTSIAFVALALITASMWPTEDRLCAPSSRLQRGLRAPRRPIVADRATVA